MKKITIMLCGIFFAAASIAQTNVDFTKKNFPNRKDALKEAMKDIKIGDQYYAKGFGFYDLALPNYLKAYAFNPNNAELNYKIGDCYLASDEKQKSIRFFQKSVSLNYKIRPDIHLKLARSLHINYRFDEAIEQYDKYRKTVSPDDLRVSGEMIQKYIEECNTGKLLVADSVRVFIDNVSELNTEYADFGAVVSADESFMAFTSRRPGSIGGKLDQFNQYFEDVYYTTKEDGRWSAPRNIGEPINTKDHDAAVGMSADGQTLFLYYGKTGGDIMMSEKKGDSWLRPEVLAKSINSSTGNENSASFSFDNKTIYFTSDNSDRVTNYGQHDIFKVTIDEKGRWGKPENLGPIVNSKYSEVDVFMHPDGRTLYFSSDGHNTMGGFDIFKTELQDDGSWSKPENLGYPINTPQDDRFFVAIGSGRRAYYSSAREEGKGSHDIYMITFLGPEKQLLNTAEDNLIAAQRGAVKEAPVFEEVVEIRTSRLTIVKGKVIDGFSDGNPPLEADIEISDNETGELISTIKSNNSTGNFLITLPSGRDYGIAVKKESFLFHSENFNIPPTSEYQEIDLLIRLLKLEKDSKIVLKNVFFETASANLDPKSYKELDLLIKIMQDHPNMRIEISGHTDNQGTRATNISLSERRAQSVVNYLSKDVPLGRMEAKGYAFDEPISDNATAEGRAQNRRVEFKILSNE
jgi:outer membrane protein OmpA-like peptidoglycan-associated protein/tetratricopeptide (TPR) repeat protein